MEYKKIRLEFDGQVAVLWMADPSVMNAAGMTMLTEMRHAVGRISHSGEARCLLITGEGKGFCSGANLGEAAASSDATDLGSGLRTGYHPLLFALRDLQMPVITAVNGPAAGAGVGLALAGDLILACKEAYFLQAFVRIGLVPDAGTTYALTRRIGWGRAIEMSMLGEKIPAELAHTWGLVNRLYENQEALMVAAKELAHRCAAGPRAMALMRQAFWKSWDNSYAEQLDLEAQLQVQAGHSDDAREGVVAFLEKRKPNFTGK